MTSVLHQPRFNSHRSTPQSLGTSLLLGLFAVVITYTALETASAVEPGPATPPDRDALLAFAQETLTFDAFCFTGDQFPACRFEHPERVEKLIGRTTLKVTWYDTQGNIVTAPRKEAGRYAAVVEIQRPGCVSKRFFTLYHLEGNARWNLRAVGTALTLPKGAAIEPTVLQSQSEDVDDLATRTLTAALKKDPAAAALLAGLHDLSELRRTGKTTDGDRASHRERQWWVDFKRKYYGYDKLYPNRFVCPRPLEGKPAPVVRAGTLAEAGMKADAVTTINAACEDWARTNGTGFGMCVVRRGVIVVNTGYGQYQGKPVTATTPAVLASATKFLDAILLLEMIDQGLIRLDDPIDKYAPALRGIKVERAMTIRDLYLHTCGLTGHDGDTWPDLEEVVADMYPALEVGARHRYQGMGLALGSKFMEMLSGEALPYLYQNHLFQPLGCSQSRAEFAAFGSSSIPLDLARIGQMMLNGGSYGDQRFFSPQAVAQMMPVPGKDRFEPDRSVRWGVGIKQLDIDALSEKAYGHPGATGSFLVIDPERQLVIAHARMSEGGSFQTFLKQKAAVIAAVVAAIEPLDKR